LPAVSAFASQIVGLGKPVTLHLETHISTAFALGYFIGNKTGTDISIIQKSPKGGRTIWSPDDTPLDDTNIQWDFSEVSISSAGTDLAVSISLSNDVSAEAESYTRSEKIGVAKMLHAKPKKGCGFNAIADANHILQYISELNNQIRDWRVSNGLVTKVHL